MFSGPFQTLLPCSVSLECAPCPVRLSDSSVPQVPGQPPAAKQRPEQKPGRASLWEPVLCYLRHHRAHLPMYAPTDAYRLLPSAGNAGKRERQRVLGWSPSRDGRSPCAAPAVGRGVLLRSPDSDGGARHTAPAAAGVLGVKPCSDEGGLSMRPRQ